VVESDNVKISVNDEARTYSLTVQNVTAENEGEYTVTASTDCAEISSTASIVIQRTFISFLQLIWYTTAF
jgi:Immunoglobulin I-set domain